MGAAVPGAIEAAAPGILPKITGVLPSVGDMLGSAQKHVKSSGLVREIISDAILWAAPHGAAALGTWQLRVKADTLRRLALVHKEIEETTRPALLEVLSVALSDIFGVNVPVGVIDPKANGLKGDSGTPGYGSLLRDALFGALLQKDQTGPNAGIDNLTTMLNSVTKTSFAAWIGDMVQLSFLEADLPGAAKLHEAIEKGIGLSRLSALALRPLITGLVANPLTRQMNARFRPTLVGAAELVHLLNATEITPTDYLEGMAGLGYPDAMAHHLMTVHSTRLDQSEAKKAHDLGEWDDAAALQYLLKKGFSDSDANLIIRTWKRDTVGKPFDRLVAVVREMFIDHEIDEAGLRDTLKLTGLKGETVEQWVNVCQVERSRPRLLSQSDAEAAFIQGIWTADALTAFYTNQRYSPESAAVLVSLATMKKVTAERAKTKLAGELPPAPVDAVRESTANEAFRRGIIDEAAYAADLRALGITGPRLDAQLAVAVAARQQYLDEVKLKKEHNEGVHVSAGSAEDLYIRSGLDDASLHAFYTARGFTEEEWPVYYKLQLMRRAEFEAKQLKALNKAAGSSTHPPAK